MITKHNDATHNRPEGERIIDAPQVFIDLVAFTTQLQSEEAWKKSDRNSITVFKTGDMRIVLGALHKGAELPAHSAEGMMSIQVLEGSLSTITDELTTTVGPGQMIAVHKNCNYRALAREDSVYLLTLSNVG